MNLYRSRGIIPDYHAITDDFSIIQAEIDAAAKAEEKRKDNAVDDRAKKDAENSLNPIDSDGKALRTHQNRLMRRPSAS